MIKLISVMRTVRIQSSNFWMVMLLAFIVSSSYSQTGPEIKTELPKIAPPSPTVAALMKFEEVPVSNYTGIPDISIPIYSVGTHSKDITIDISLKYHPASIAVEEEAGYVGLGWNLFAGGSISRTVRGLPDEISENGKRLGIYNYTQQSGMVDYHTVRGYFGPNITAAQKQILNIFLWDGQERGFYDTQHDLYQFNFMGYSGRFYIKKTNGSFQVIRLDNDNNIVINYDDVAKQFLLYDDKGFTYRFDVKEVTYESTVSEHILFENGLPPNTSNTDIYNYISAFQLSKIEDTGGNLLAEFIYNTNLEPMPETYIDVTNTLATGVDANANPVSVIADIRQNGGDTEQVMKIDPKETTTVSYRSTSTKKIKQILVAHKAKINFTLVNDREDTDNEGTYRLQNVIVTDWNNNVIKKVDLIHSYSEINDKARMLLSKVTENDASNTLSQSYGLAYVEPSKPSYGKDYWGYFNSKPINYPTNAFREASAQACKINALQKMTLPGGGAVIFNFESNTYSHSGNEALATFDDNPDNWSYTTTQKNFVSPPLRGGSPQQIIALASSQRRYITLQPYSTSVANQGGSFTLYKKLPGGTAISLGGINCGDNDGTCFTPEIELEQGYEYSISYNWLNSEVSGSGYVKVFTRTKNTNDLQFLYGGGIRIKNIGYFENGNVDQKYYDSAVYQENALPSKQVNYDYHMFSNGLKSSGALVFPKPIYEYIHPKTYHIEIKDESGMVRFHYLQPLSLKKFTTFNNLSVLRTKGADVGYQNVTVSESGNGSTQYTYTSPIDYPETPVPVLSQFLPSKNFDYKRGLLLNEKIKTQSGTTLKENVYTYSFIESEQETGIKTNGLSFCPYRYKYSNGNMYYTLATECTGGICENTCGLASEYIGYGFILEAVGRAELTSKLTKEYFTNGTTETLESFTYNPTNKRIASHSTQVYNSGTAVETQLQNYFYTASPALTALNKISDIERIESRKDGILLGTQKIIYNTAYQPATIQAAKGTQPLENRVQFLQYDGYNNPLEVKLENGTSTVYVWGYNSTQPIAMIENVANYATVPSTLVTAAQNASNGSNEAALITALDNLRNSPALAGAMVTTYTYKPAIGISTVTDPKGYRTSYFYDGFGRLKEVRDMEGKLLSENEYHYKTP